MKIYVHQGNGHYVGSCVTVLAEGEWNAKLMIRQELNNQGLQDEKVEIVKVVELHAPAVVVSINGDY